MPGGAACLLLGALAAGAAAVGTGAGDEPRRAAPARTERPAQTEQPARTERPAQAGAAWNGLGDLWRAFPRQPRPPAAVIDGLACHQVASWTFADGFYPGGWSWGEWRLVEGALEGRAGGDSFAVYVCPCAHGGDFALEAEVRLLPAGPGQAAEAHLLTRDGAGLRHETGMAVTAGQRRVSVRHTTNRRDHVLQIAERGQPLAPGVWHRLTVLAHRGRVTFLIDGERIFVSPPNLPSGLYREPHLAVRGGRAQFRNLHIYATR